MKLREYIASLQTIYAAEGDISVVREGILEEHGTFSFGSQSATGPTTKTERVWLPGFHIPNEGRWSEPTKVVIIK